MRTRRVEPETNPPARRVQRSPKALLTVLGVLLLLVPLKAWGSGEPDEVTLTGTVEGEHLDTFSEEGSFDGWVLRTSRNRYYRLVMPDTGNEGGEPSLAMGDFIQVTGRLDEKMSTLKVEGSAIEVLGKAPPGAALAPTGVQNVLVIVIDLSDGVVSCTVPQVEDIWFTPAVPNTIDKLYRATSFNDMSLAGDVARVTLPNRSVTENCLGGARFMWASEAQNLLASTYNLSSYDYFMHVVPSTTNCPPGITVPGGPWAWVSQCANSQAYSHELGHQFGMGHADGKWTNGIVYPYFDHSDTMGAYQHRLNAPHLEEMGWIGGANIINVSGSGGTYFIDPLYKSMNVFSFARMLKIYDPQVGENLYVSLRDDDGPFDSSLDPGFVDALSLHHYKSPGWPSNKSTVLLDKVSSGQTWCAYNDTLKIRHLGAMGTGAAVEVDIHPCFNSPFQCIPLPDPDCPGGSPSSN